MLKAILFDMDGVLLDSETLHYQIIKDMMSERGYCYTMEHFQKYCGVREKDMWKSLLKELGADDVDSIKAQEEHWILYRQQLSQKGMPFFPGTAECLRELMEKDYLLAVVSASSEKVILDYINQLGYTKYFKYFVSAQYCAHGKPEPDVFLLAAKQLGVNTDECLVVEDSKNGMIAAQRAGMKWVGFSGAEIPTDMSNAPFTFSDYREVTSDDFEMWFNS